MLVCTVFFLDSVAIPNTVQKKVISTREQLEQKKSKLQILLKKNNDYLKKLSPDMTSSRLKIRSNIIVIETEIQAINVDLGISE